MVVLAAPARAWAQPSAIQSYTDAKAAYDAGNYEDAVRRFGPLVDDGPGQLTDRIYLQDSRKYYGASLVFVGRNADAVAVFEALLRDDAEAEMPAALFPTRARDLFNQVKTDMREELRRQQEELRRAQERERREQEARLRAEILSKAVLFERTVERRPLWQGFLPFGIAQFQNGQDTRGVLFLAGEGLMLAVNVTSYFLWQGLPPAEQGEAPINDTIQDVSFYANLASLCALVALFGLGAWDGVANLETERVVTRRLTPEEVEDAIEAGTAGSLER